MAALIDGMIALRTEKRVDAAFDQGLRREVTDWFGRNIVKTAH